MKKGRNLLWEIEAKNFTKRTKVTIFNFFQHQKKGKKTKKT
jgi:hypothetical protein